MNPAAEAMLRRHRVARLATADRAGHPHCVPVCYYWDGTAIYIALDEKPKTVDVRRLRRVRNIEENPSVCFLLDHYSDDWSELQFLQATGTAALVDPVDAVVEGLRERYPQYRTMAIDRLPMIRIQPERWVLWPPPGCA